MRRVKKINHYKAGIVELAGSGNRSYGVTRKRLNNIYLRGVSRWLQNAPNADMYQNYWRTGTEMV